MPFILPPNPWRACRVRARSSKRGLALGLLCKNAHVRPLTVSTCGALRCGSSTSEAPAGERSSLRPASRPRPRGRAEAEGKWGLR